jgi:hypothetical protein
MKQFSLILSLIINLLFLHSCCKKKTEILVENKKKIERFNFNVGDVWRYSAKDVFSTFVDTLTLTIIDVKKFNGDSNVYLALLQERDMRIIDSINIIQSPSYFRIHSINVRGSKIGDTYFKLPLLTYDKFPGYNPKDTIRINGVYDSISYYGRKYRYAFTGIRKYAFAQYGKVLQNFTINQEDFIIYMYYKNNTYVEDLNLYLIDHN